MNESAASIDVAAGTTPFITFEGGEGVGKSTQILLLKLRLEAAGYQVLILREPGGTAIGEQIRNILLNPVHKEMSAVAELLLYEAARAQLVNQVVRPALANKTTVLCDRFTDSTLAYQAAARGLCEDTVRYANTLGADGLVPHRTIILARDIEFSLSKATEKGPDRLEAEGIEFHQKVHAAFAKLAQEEPNRVRLIHLYDCKAQTANAIFSQLEDLFPLAKDREFVIDDALISVIKESR